MAFGRGRMGGEFDQDGETLGGGTESSSAGGLTAFIDQGSSFEGKLSFKDTVRIDGHFSGEIASENTLVVGESGEIEANVRSQTVIVSGLLVGDVDAGRKVVMHKTARIEGNVKTPVLVMEEGAVLNGRLEMAEPRKTPLKAVEGGSSATATPASQKPATPPQTPKAD